MSEGRVVRANGRCSTCRAPVSEWCRAIAATLCRRCERVLLGGITATHGRPAVPSQTVAARFAGGPQPHPIDEADPAMWLRHLDLAARAQHRRRATALHAPDLADPARRPSSPIAEKLPAVPAKLAAARACFNTCTNGPRAAESSLLAHHVSTRARERCRLSNRAPCAGRPVVRQLLAFVASIP